MRASADLEWQCAYVILLGNGVCAVLLDMSVQWSMPDSAGHECLVPSCMRGLFFMVGQYAVLLQYFSIERDTAFP
jgi:hypothetical protein